MNKHFSVCIYEELADNQVLIAQEYEEIEFIVWNLSVEYEKWGLKIYLEKFLYMGWRAETKETHG